MHDVDVLYIAGCGVLTILINIWILQWSGHRCDPHPERRRRPLFTIARQRRPYVPIQAGVGSFCAWMPDGVGLGRLQDDTAVHSCS